MDTWPFWDLGIPHWENQVKLWAGNFFWEFCYLKTFVQSDRGEAGKLMPGRWRSSRKRARRTEIRSLTVSLVRRTRSSLTQAQPSAHSTRCSFCSWQQFSVLTGRKHLVSSGQMKHEDFQKGTFPPPAKVTSTSLEKILYTLQTITLTHFASRKVHSTSLSSWRTSYSS